MKIIVELNEEEDKKVEIYKAEKKLDSKAKAIAKMIDEFKINVEIK